MLNNELDYHRNLHLKKLNEIKTRKNKFLEINTNEIKKITPNLYCIIRLT